MKKFIRGLVVFVAILVLGAFFALSRLQPVVEREVRTQLKNGCAKCEFSLGGIGLTWSGIKLSDVRLSGGDKSGQLVEIDAPKIVLRPILSSLLSGQARFHTLVFVGPKVKLIDKERPGRMPSSEVVEASPIPIDKILVSGGEFTYVRDVKGTHATLVIENINAAVKPDAKKIEGQLTGRIGSSGSVELAVSMPVSNHRLHVDTEWRIKDQDLAALGKFFEPNAGVEVRGKMIRGHAITRMRDARMSASMFSEYKDFKLKLHKMYDRPEFQAIVANVAAQIALREKNIDQPRDEKLETVELERQPGESVVSFTLRGLKEAALAVAL